MMDKNKKLLIAGVTALTLGLGTFGGIQVVKAAELRSFNEMKQNEYVEYMNENEGNFSFDVEYGAASKEINYNLDKFVSVLHYDELDTKELGEHEIKIEVMDADEYITELTYNVNVVDTKAPVFSGIEDITIENGDDFDVNALEITAKDPVDGKVDVKFSGDVDTATDGEYEITATAVDVNENETKETFTVTVETTPVAPQATYTPSSNSGSTGSSSSNGGGSSSYEPAPARTDGFNFHGYHFPITWFYGGGGDLVPADQYVYRYAEIPNHYLFEHFGEAGVPVRSLYVGDIITVDGQKYQIVRREGGLANDGTAGGVLYSQAADITFQTCDLPILNSPLTLWWANAI